MAHIIVIDDELSMRSLMRLILEQSGYDVAEAQDGNEGIQLQKVQPADLVITDLIMPEKENFETIMELKSAFPDTKIIAISGGGQFIDKDKFLQIANKSGADYALAKPFEKEELLIQDLTDSHPTASHELKHQSVPEISGSEDHFVNDFFLQDLPLNWFPMPKEFPEHGIIAGITKFGVD